MIDTQQCDTGVIPVVLGGRVGRRLTLIIVPLLVLLGVGFVIWVTFVAGLDAGSSAAQILAVPLAAAGGVAAIVLARRNDEPARGSIGATDRVTALRANLAESRRLIGEINAEFELQVAATERIKAEAEENERLAALNRDEAEAVRNLVAQTVEGAQRKATKLGGRQQWLFFLAGLLFAIPLGVAGNFAFEFVKSWLAT